MNECRLDDPGTSYSKKEEESIINGEEKRLLSHDPSSLGIEVEESGWGVGGVSKSQDPWPPITDSHPIWRNDKRYFVNILFLSSVLSLNTRLLYPYSCVNQDCFLYRRTTIIVRWSLTQEKWLSFYNYTFFYSNKDWIKKFPIFYTI